ncbi:hypothetical protein ACAG39_04820 [Caldicellulosiruptoraceae bacterium PP1]
MKKLLKLLTCIFVIVGITIFVFTSFAQETKTNNQKKTKDTVSKSVYNSAYEYEKIFNNAFNIFVSPKTNVHLKISTTALPQNEEFGLTNSFEDTIFERKSSKIYSIIGNNEQIIYIIGKRLLYKDLTTNTFFEIPKESPLWESTVLNIGVPETNQYFAKFNDKMVKLIKSKKPKISETQARINNLSGKYIKVDISLNNNEWGPIFYEYLSSIILENLKLQNKAQGKIYTDKDIEDWKTEIVNYLEQLKAGSKNITYYINPKTKQIAREQVVTVVYINDKKHYVTNISDVIDIGDKVKCPIISEDQIQPLPNEDEKNTSEKSS